MTTKVSTPVRIDADLYAEASSVASVMSRSTTQQIAHWARIGRELEASPHVSVEAISSVLRRSKSYDELGNEEQAIVRAFWAERMDALRDALRLQREFESQGRPYVELDDSGRVVRHEPNEPGSGSSSRDG
jgi:hypothetical protein